MPDQDRLRTNLVEKTNQELIRMFTRPDDWTPEALQVARTELIARSVPVEHAVAQTISEESIVRSKEELSIGSAVGVAVLAWTIIPGLFVTRSMAAEYKRDGYLRKARSCWRIYLCILGSWILLLALAKVLGYI